MPFCVETRKVSMVWQSRSQPDSVYVIRHMTPDLMWGCTKMQEVPAVIELNIGSADLRALPEGLQGVPT